MLLIVMGFINLALAALEASRGEFGWTVLHFGIFVFAMLVAVNVKGKP